ncbi:hypothetical protein B0H15DRAFT_781298 [Mycena belliarum]|uniref:DUF3533 domain-containing protein n=1 Tax=Mycena belliarum TaxID=1033014 RepID=A0AAD6U4N5_9AGAR|nr:hypothetical protein B0H15DRAFT_781298 [Mycena belliae]
MSGARAVYLKAMVGGITALTIVIFVVFSIYWGSVWQTPHHALPGWIVDFDGGVAGQAISAALGAIQPGTTGVAWQVVSASRFQGGVADVAHSVLQEKTWYAVTINPGASANLSAAVSTVNSSYNSSLAVTFLGSEARNEYIYRIHSRIVAAQLEGITHQFALQFVRNISSSGNLSALASTAPELLLRPIYYTAQNMRPFDVPVASAITFVGLIYLLILSFFIVNISASARAASGLEANLTFGSLVRVRLASSFVAYFFIALFYTLLSRAFQLPFDRHFGRAGLVIFWMLNYIGMLACGLALEVMMTFLTARFVPFFLIVFIITNVSVSAFPIQVLPHIYRYGFAFPFYNISRAVRSIVFSTKNDLGMNFGILFAWVALSCITLPLTQWLARRRLIVEQARA